MGRIAKVLQFFRTVRDNAFVSQVQLKSTSKVLYTSDHFQDAGSDSQPLQGDFSIVVNTVKTGGSVSVGYVDPKNAGITGPGEKRIYSRDSNGNIKASLHLKSDGSSILKNDNVDIELFNDGSVVIQNALLTFAMNSAGALKISNPLGLIELRADGVIDLNGALFDPSGAGSAPSLSADSILVDGKELKDHTHPVTSAPGTTGPNN